MATKRTDYSYEKLVSNIIHSSTFCPLTIIFLLIPQENILSKFEIALEKMEHDLSYARAMGLALKAHIQTLLREERESLPKSEDTPPRKHQKDSLPNPSPVIVEFTPLSVPPRHYRIRAQKTLPDLRKAHQRQSNHVAGPEPDM